METIPSFEELDSSVQEQLDLKTFQVNFRFSFGFVSSLANYVQGKFDVKDFVGSVSEKLITQSKADAGRTCCSSGGHCRT